MTVVCPGISGAAGPLRIMDNDHDDDDLDFESDDFPPALSSRVDQLSRRWSGEEAERRNRHHHRARRRIEDWREQQSLKRELEGDIEAE